MRFDRMFEDLEGQMDHLEAEQRRAVAEDLTRAERAQISFADRLRAAEGQEVRLRLAAGVVCSGVVQEVGEDWVRLHDAAAGEEVWVRQQAIKLADHLPVRARQRAASAISLPTIGQQLRMLARDRALVRIGTVAGRYTGRIARVGRDAFDLSLLPSGEVADSVEAGYLTVRNDALMELRTVGA